MADVFVLIEDIFLFQTILVRHVVFLTTAGLTRLITFLR